MKSIKLFISCLLLIFMVGTLYAQNIQVTGTVLDEEGQSLPGAGVKVVGTTTVVATDMDGKFSIKAPANGTLTVTFTGYKTLQVPINGRASITIKMELDAEMLQETVVIGYGTAKKITSVVGAASTVGKKVFENRPIANAGDALQGQVSGLQVYTSTGEPSATVSMRLRGVNSINAGTTPLFILDGSPVSASIFSTLQSNDIENITVLKDASSTAIYGSRAANGVVYITTKKGTSETPLIKVNASYGVSNIASYPQKAMNSEQYFTFREMVDPALKSNQQFQQLKDFRLKNNIGTNWRKWIMNENAPTWNAEMSMSGRSTRTDYYISLGAMSQEGIEHFSNNDRYSVRSNINTRLTDWLKFGINLGIVYQKYKTAGYSTTGNSWYNPLNIATWNLPYASAYEILTDANGNFTGYGDELDYINDMGTWNYFYLTKLQPSKRSYLRLNGNMYQEIHPIKGLVIRASQAVEGYDYTNSSKVLSDPNKLLTPSATEYFSRYYRATSTNTAEYKFSLLDNNHFTALIGQESILSNSKDFSASSKGHSDNRMMNVDQGTTFNKPTYAYSQVTYNSLFARLSYDYADKYFIDGTIRRDGSSLFGANNRYANFWSVGAMWSAKKENFFKDINWLNNLQLRVSYGTTGNSAIDNYLSYGLVGTGTIYNGNASWGLSSVDNKDLTWETVESLNVGVNARLFNFVDLNIEFYNKMTKDMLMEIPYSYSTGFGSAWGNTGNMRNRGIDVELGFDILNTKDFFFRAGVNFNYNKNEITKLFGGRDEFIVPNTGIKYQVGKSYGDFYYVKYAGVDPATGAPLYYDKEGKITTEYSENNAVFTGKNRYAPMSGGLNLDFSWNGISLNVAFAGVFGKWLLNNDRYFSENPNFAAESNQSARMMNMWTTPGQKTDIPGANYAVQFDTHLLENASFIRLKNLQISYSLPKVWMQKTKVLNGVRVYALARNLWTITKYKGYDPENDSNLSLGKYPNSKQYTVGIELTF